jgi:hypothetical protein
MQLLLTHCVPVLQVCPFAFLQTPAPSHMLVPVQALTGLLSTAPLARFEQVPAVAALRLQVRHVEQLALPQQTASTQLVLRHVVPVPHICPLFDLHAPLPSQALVPVHVTVAMVSVMLKAMLPQTPSAPPPFFATVQAWHVPVQAVLQQTPSAQLPFAHWLLVVQA